MQHLGSGAFEQASTAPGKKGVPAKNQGTLAVRGSPISHMAGGMTWHIEHLQYQTLPVDMVAGLNGPMRQGQRLHGWSCHLGGCHFHQLGHAPGVIGMMVRDKDLLKPDTGMIVQPADHDFGLTGVHHHGR